MDSIQDAIKEKIMGAVVADQISDKLGVSKEQAQGLTDMALPILMEQLGRNVEDEGGAQALDAALEKDHDGSILDNIGSIFGNKEAEDDGGKILDHVFGDKLGAVTSLLGGSSKVKESVVATVLQLLAPIVLGQIGLAKKQEGLDASGLASLLGQEKKKADDNLGPLAKILDADDDGSVVDDLIGVGAKFF